MKIVGMNRGPETRLGRGLTATLAVGALAVVLSGCEQAAGDDTLREGRPQTTITAAQQRSLDAESYGLLSATVFKITRQNEPLGQEGLLLQAERPEYSMHRQIRLVKRDGKVAIVLTASSDVHSPQKTGHRGLRMVWTTPADWKARPTTPDELLTLAHKPTTHLAKIKTADAVGTPETRGWSRRVQVTLDADRTLAIDPVVSNDPLTTERIELGQMSWYKGLDKTLIRDQMASYVRDELEQSGANLLQVP